MPKPRITRSRGNVFRDLGFAPEEADICASARSS